ncbi:phytochelatin synthase family protein [Vibrio natriegens]|uniref:phytochelatin synthase family protein n=1 Tax=Vibrio natriegens TaxID=691 RepID=UPI003CE58096
MMNFRYIMVTLLLTTCSASQATHLYWGQSGALECLMHSQYHGDFAKLSNYHESQENKMFCGVATAVTILNALEIGRLFSTSGHRLPFYIQT